MVLKDFDNYYFLCVLVISDTLVTSVMYHQSDTLVTSVMYHQSDTLVSRVVYHQSEIVYHQ